MCRVRGKLSKISEISLILAVNNYMITSLGAVDETPGTKVLTRS